jgi:hypothetical protein
MPPEADQFAEVRLAFVLTIQDAMRLVEGTRRVLEDAGEPDQLNDAVRRLLAVALPPSQPHSLRDLFIRTAPRGRKLRPL